jgi:enoyl-CoA hydratase/carnithine racemase
MPDPLVLYEVDEKVGIVTLNRPEKLNAISAELQEQLTDAFARADADPRTSVVLLRAEDRSFCAGYDISAKDDWRGDPTRAHEHFARSARFRDGAVAHEKAGHRVGSRLFLRRGDGHRRGSLPKTAEGSAF